MIFVKVGVGNKYHTIIAVIVGVKVGEDHTMIGVTVGIWEGNITQ